MLHSLSTARPDSTEPSVWHYSVVLIFTNHMQLCSSSIWIFVFKHPEMCLKQYFNLVSWTGCNCTICLPWNQWRSLLLVCRRILDSFTYANVQSVIHHVRYLFLPAWVTYILIWYVLIHLAWLIFPAVKHHTQRTQIVHETGKLGGVNKISPSLKRNTQQTD